MAIEFRDARVDAGDGEALERAMVAEMHELYAGLDMDSHDMPKAGPNELSPPSGGFVVGYENGQPVCCAGVKRLDDEACEIKRMYVVPGARGRGVARAMLGAIEEKARTLGFTIARLDTGSKQPHAKALYESAGYRPIGNFNNNPEATYFGEKTL